MSEAIIVALITAGASVICQLLISNKTKKDNATAQAVRDKDFEDRMKRIEERLDQHNNYAEKYNNYAGMNAHKTCVCPCCLSIHPASSTFNIREHTLPEKYKLKH